MPLFGGPNVEKLQAKRDVQELAKVLRYQSDWHVRKAAAEALGQLGDVRAVGPLIYALGYDDGARSSRAVLREGRMSSPDQIGGRQNVAGPSAVPETGYLVRIRQEVKGFPAAISRTERHSAVVVEGEGGAGDGVRTRDIQLGKLTLCQLSYSRSGGRHLSRDGRSPQPDVLARRRPPVGPTSRTRTGRTRPGPAPRRR
jgi:PBS lyase HEAT-like repeat